MIKKMNILTKLHQSFVVEKIKKTDWSNGTTSPLIVELDPTAVCDLACPSCISEDIIAIGNSFSSKRLLELGKEFKKSDVRGVILIGGGEPLAHPASGELIRYFGENDISVGITTNGTFINRYMEEIAEYSITRIWFEALLALVYQIAIIYFLDLTWQGWLLCHWFFALHWSALQYVDHAWSPRDIINGAWNLKVHPISRLIALNYHLHLAHHRYPNIPWIYLPKLVNSKEPYPSFWSIYKTLWSGVRPAPPMNSPATYPFKKSL